MKFPPVRRAMRVAFEFQDATLGTRRRGNPGPRHLLPAFEDRAAMAISRLNLVRLIRRTALLTFALAAPLPAAEPVRFNRDVLPI